jgi:hypothetical protein
MLVDIRCFLVATGSPIATAFLPPELDLIRYAVAFLLVGIHLVREGPFRRGGRGRSTGAPALRFHRMDRSAHRGPQERGGRIVSVQVLFALAASSAAQAVRRRAGGKPRRRSASASCCWRW